MLLLAAVGLIALLLVGPRLVDAYVNWLWFGEVGFRSVWVTVLLTRVAIFVAVALVVGGTVFLALMLAYRSRPVFVPAARPNDPMRAVSDTGDAPVATVRWRVAIAVDVLRGLRSTIKHAFETLRRILDVAVVDGAITATRAHRCSVPGRPTPTPSRSPPVR